MLCVNVDVFKIVTDVKAMDYILNRYNTQRTKENMVPFQDAQFALNKLTNKNNPFIDPKHFLTDAQVTALESIISENDKDWTRYVAALTEDQHNIVGW